MAKGTAKTPKGRPKATGKPSRSIDSYFRPPLAPLPAAINQNARRHQPQGGEVVADAFEKPTDAIKPSLSTKKLASDKEIPDSGSDSDVDDGRLRLPAKTEDDKALTPRRAPEDSTPPVKPSPSKRHAPERAAEDGSNVSFNKLVPIEECVKKAESPTKRRRVLKAPVDGNKDESKEACDTPTLSPGDAEASGILDGGSTKGDVASGPGFYRRKMEESMKTATIINWAARPVEAESDEVDDDPFSFVYTLDILEENLDYRGSVNWHKTSLGRAVWQLWALKRGSKRYLADVPATNGHVHDPHRCSREEAVAICEKLVDAVKRWKDLNDISNPNRPSDTIMGRRLLVAAQYSLFPGKPLRCAHPGLHWTTVRGKKQLNFVRGFIYYIDEETLKHDSMFINVPKGMGSEADPPVVMDLVFIDRGKSSWSLVDGGDAYPSAIGPEVDLGEYENERHLLQQDERLLWYLLSILMKKSPFTTKGELNTLIQRHLRPVRCSYDQQKTAYNGGPLLRRDHASGRLIKLTLNEAVKRDVSGDLPNSMQINSVDRSWEEPITKEVLATWTKTGNILDALMMLADSVDEANQKIKAGEKSPAECSCSVQESLHSKHPCARCGRETPCTLLIMDSQAFRACPTCHMKSFIPVTEVKGRRSLYHAARDETRKVPWLPPSHVSEVVSGAEPWIREVLAGQPGRVYIDMYSGNPITQPDKGPRHPLAISADAIFPFIVDGDGKTKVHWVGNVAFTPMCLNLAKATQIPMFLQFLGNYFPTAEILVTPTGISDPSTFDELQERMIVDCRRVTDIRVRAGRHLGRRLSRDVSPDQFRYYLEEWRSGKPHTGRPAPKPRPFSRSQIASMSWETSEAGLLRIVEEIEQWAGLKLPRRGGCPYMGHPSTIPWSWSWGGGLGLMAHRLHRMKTKYNRKWVTDESPDSLFVESIFQACANRMVVAEGDSEFGEKVRMKAKYGEFLHLPLVVDMSNPLNLSVAHRHPHPTCFADRSDSANNMLIETQTSNYLKAEYDEVHYPTLKRVVGSINVPKIYADENQPISPYNPKLELRSSPRRATDFQDESDDESETDYEWKAMDDDEEVMG